MPEHALTMRRRPGTGWVRALAGKGVAQPPHDLAVPADEESDDAAPPVGQVADVTVQPDDDGENLTATRDPAADIDPRMEQRRRDVHAAQTRRRLRVLRAVVIAVVAGLLADALLHSPLLDVRRPRVSGEVQTSPVDILRAGGLTGHPLMIRLSLTRAARAIERLPWIATARVRRSWPDTVIVTVTERVPAAIVVSDLVDASGRVLSPAPAFAPLVPVRVDTGATAPVVPPPGEPVPGIYRPGLAVAAAMPAAVRTRVTAVLVRPDGTVRLALTTGTSALLGDTGDLAAKFEALLTILERVQVGRAPIDVSVPTAPVLLTSPAAAATVSTHTGG
jgi:cell division protein FtsQ